MAIHYGVCTYNLALSILRTLSFQYPVVCDAIILFVTTLAVQLKI